MINQNQHRQQCDAENQEPSRGQVILTTIGDPDTRTVTQSEAAKRMQVSRSTIYRLAKDGVLASVPMRGRTRIVLASVFDYIRKQGKEEKNG